MMAIIIGVSNDACRDRPELESVVAKKLAELTKEVLSSEELPSPAPEDPLYKIKQGFQGFKAYFKYSTAYFYCNYQRIESSSMSDCF